MNSNSFGPPLWEGLFFIAAGYDLNETPKQVKNKDYREFFRTLGEVLPCRYCRESYRGFFQQLNIDRYFQMPSCGVIKFVYDLKDCVNSKLKMQEHKALHEEFESLRQTTPLETEEFWARFRDKAHKICYTKPTPPFEKVVQDLYKHRAGCSSHMKTCKRPLNETEYPQVPMGPIYDPNTTGLLDRDVYSGGKRGKRISRVKRSTGRQRKSTRRRTVSRRRSRR